MQAPRKRSLIPVLEARIHNSIAFRAEWGKTTNISLMMHHEYHHAGNCSDRFKYESAKAE
ncbi:hypothetical protein H6F86_27835 [Phormidium sp. FACHB-592]|uniref:hypothetical protein n=1 Tax=Cyanophyceae TaxID=3028117 RepID=UPI001688D8D2|nr:hypothetical protein [Phormidium sp. FACHB-592]MBD2077626.1 hypothetical protein [Phormidium sp. FACHB-592]